MIDELKTLFTGAQTALSEANSQEDLTAWHKNFLSRKGTVTLQMQQLGKLSAEERPIFGRQLNEIKQTLQTEFDLRQEEIKQLEISAEVAKGTIDISLPGRQTDFGGLHPATKTLREIYKIWSDMGFQIYRSREIETDEYNFEMLNIPQNHPARDMWDTFHLDTPGNLLRTHTSPGQIHAMKEYCPNPIRVILPGMVYRYEQVTARSEFQFHQVEGLAIGENITFADLKGTLTDFARRMFGENQKVRFRANYFPFTEPSAEMDVECILCKNGCTVCKYSKWLEILGCGMVHPTVLQNGGYDPDKYTGFAFGMGPERIAMLKHGITDIRYFWSNDLRFLKQF